MSAALQSCVLLLFRALFSYALGPYSVTAKRRAQDAAKKFERVIMMLHSDISNHRNGAIFQNPIKPSEAPDYHEIVKRPMDLKTMKARIKSGHISTSTEFQRDIYLMFANSMMYNKPSSDIYGMAEEVSWNPCFVVRWTDGLR